MKQVALLKDSGNKWLYEEMDTISSHGYLDESVPSFMVENLNPEFELRDYQKDAFVRFFYHYGRNSERGPMHLLYNMATGSGKTLVMAGLILYLYDKGYRNFLFFVNSKNIIEKTKDNFLNCLSIKYLFSKKIVIGNREVRINAVDNFEGVNKDDVNVCFTTIQKLHSDLNLEKENSLTFEDFKNQGIVLLADEAHHGQVKTKQRTLRETANWENTVESIFKQNKRNVLLEFTATMDFMNDAIGRKYFRKIIYMYDLKSFRQDKFSKDVEILRSDTDKKGRILLALILNQYRQDVASRHGIRLKPVVLFKSQKTIRQSEENKEFFHNLIESLSRSDIEEIRKKTNIKEIKRAFVFFEDQKIGADVLVEKLKLNFARNKCISMNDEKALRQNQILINTLEKADNQIRVIFTVQKLNEGWDVLNLFDIVRLYDGQAGRGGYGKSPSSSTISEAQLIGRGARYFPFKRKGHDENRFLRKFDEDLNNELRILEELHFHSPDESRYISELKKALVEEGIMDDKLIEKDLKLKEEFKRSEFYRRGLIFTNKKAKNDYSNVKSFGDLGVKEKIFKYEIPTYKGKVTKALTDEQYDNFHIQKKSVTLKISQIDKHVIRSAVYRKEFFKFENVKRFFPKITSVSELIESENFLGNLSISFTGSSYDIERLSNSHKFAAVLRVLDEIEDKLKNKMVDYRGTKEFSSKKIKEVFRDKTIKVEAGSERADGQEDFIRDKDWYAFNANYGTDQEKAFVVFIDRLIGEDFKHRYDEIFLVRNELHFVIHNFKDGNAFAPDFVLFMKRKTGKEEAYQIFIEPKGKHLMEADKWKSDFLSEIASETKNLAKFIETGNCRVVGVPFFNKEAESKFKEDLLDSLKSSE